MNYIDVVKENDMENTKENIFTLLERMINLDHECLSFISGDSLKTSVKSELASFRMVCSMIDDQDFFNQMWDIHMNGDNDENND